MSLEELKEILFHDFNLIKRMRCPEPRKIKLVSNLFVMNPDGWRVVGITPAALDVFSKHGFERRSGMRVNRAHVIPRYKTYENMLEMQFSDKDELWDYYWERDHTILSTSSENMKSVSGNSSYFEVPQDHRILFRMKGFAWKHGDEEVAFLRELHKNRGSKQLKLLKSALV